MKRILASLCYPAALLMGPVPGLAGLILGRDRWTQRHAVKSLMLFAAEIGWMVAVMGVWFFGSAIVASFQGPPPEGELTGGYEGLLKVLGVLASLSWLSLLAWSFVLARRAFSGDEASGDWIDKALDPAR